MPSTCVLASLHLDEFFYMQHSQAVTHVWEELHRKASSQFLWEIKPKKTLLPTQPQKPQEGCRMQTLLTCVRPFSGDASFAFLGSQWQNIGGGFSKMCNPSCAPYCKTATDKAAIDSLGLMGQRGRRQSQIKAEATRWSKRGSAEHKFAVSRMKKARTATH